MNKSAEGRKTIRDFIGSQLLRSVDDLVRLCRSGDFSDSFRSAQYDFLWNASLADPEALEAAYDRMIEDGACYDMPIDSNAVFGRILIMAIVQANPTRAAEVFETLINLNADPGEADHIKYQLLGIT